MASPDHLAPYSARVVLTSSDGRLAEPHAMVASLLEDIAARCTAAGASIIGHLKCHVRADSGEHFHANLTSLRSGARAEGDPISEAVALQIDLVVLVYGVPLERVAESVQQALAAMAAKAGAHWTVDQEQGEHH